MHHGSYKYGSCVLLVCAATTATVQAESVERISEMVTKGEASLDFRYRYENVDQDAFDRTASANTLRSRLMLSSATWHGVSGLLEADNVWDFGSDNYNSTENGNTDRPVIADPTGNDLNQIWLKYSANDYVATGGRQRILHGNQRFIGGVAWRQNEQTFDGLRGQWNALEGLQIDAAYVYNVNRIFGPDDGSKPADWEGDNFLLRGNYSINEQHKVSLLGYWLDIDTDGPYDAPQTVNNSTDTNGIEYNGTLGWLTLGATWASQSEAGDSELDYDADYYAVELSTTVKSLELHGGYEVLGADNGVGFKTPLATLHKFQGWADVFIETPEDGIQDLYGSVGTSLGAFNLTAVYHDFQAEDSSEDLGTELDLSAVWNIRDNLYLQTTYASFDADTTRYSDTDKVWLIVHYTY